MSKLEFRAISLADYDTVEPYLYAYGEGSCQHSFTALFSLSEKYGDCVCERDGFLYILRSRLCGDGWRVYLSPMGEGDLRAAYEAILDDARSHGVKAKFVTLTRSHRDFLEQAFPGQFDFEENRDLAEYIYRTEIMATLPGGKLAKRRKEAHQFWNTYGGRATVERITPADFGEILEFEKRWLDQNREDHDMASLEREARAIRLQIEHFDELKLSGVVLRLDGEVRGYGYGVRLSDLYYDALIEKGDKDLVYAYRVLRVESVRRCAMDCKYVNLEEDLGIPGLRALKNAYQPEFLMDKYVVTQR